MLASCALDVKVHDFQNGECVTTVPDPNSEGFLDIDWSNEGNNLIAVPSFGNSLLITPTCTSSTIDITDARCATFFKKKLGYVLIGTINGEVIVYNTIRKKVSHKLSKLPSTVTTIKCGADDSFVAAGCNNGQIFGYERQSFRLSSSYCIPGSEAVTTIAVHGTIPYLLAGGSERGIVAIWDLDSGNCILRSTKHKGPVMDMAFSETDYSFTTVGSDKTIKIYDLRTAGCVHDKQFENCVTALAYCPNGQDLAVGTRSGLIICIDKRFLRTAKSVLQAHQEPIRKVAFRTHDILSKLLVKPFPVSSDRNVPDLDYEYQNSSTSINKTDEANVIINNPSFDDVRSDIMRETKGILQEFMAKISNEFVKMRLDVCKEFTEMETRNENKFETKINK